MAKAVIYHNPRCSKSRQTLALLEEKGADIEVVEYLKETPDAATLDKLLTLLGKEPQEIVRKGEAVYKELGLKEKQLSRAEWIEVLVANPVLIERPIVVAEGKACLGRPPENVNELL